MGGKTQGQGPANAAAGSGMSAAIAPLEVALSGVIGARIRITTAPPTTGTLEGTLFTACAITSLVAINTTAAQPSATSPTDSIQTQPGNYHIIPISRIQSFQLLSLPSNSTTDGPSFTNASPALHPLDIRALKAREANAITKLQEREARRGKGVTREAQDLFDAFSRTMPARWDGTSIVVADAVVIAKPYRVNDCRPLVSGDSAALTHVRKVLEMERKKIELRNASATIGNAGSFARHGSTTQTSIAGKERDARSAAVAVPAHLDSPAIGSAGQRKGG